MGCLEKDLDSPQTVCSDSNVVVRSALNRSAARTVVLPVATLYRQSLAVVVASHLLLTLLMAAGHDHDGHDGPETEDGGCVVCYFQQTQGRQEHTLPSLVLEPDTPCCRWATEDPIVADRPYEHEPLRGPPSHAWST